MNYDDIKIGEKYIFHEIVKKNDDESVDDELKNLVGQLVTVRKKSSQDNDSCCIHINEINQSLRPAELRPYSEWDL